MQGTLEAVADKTFSLYPEAALTLITIVAMTWAGTKLWQAWESRRAHNNMVDRRRQSDKTQRMDALIDRQSNLNEFEKVLLQGFQHHIEALQKHNEQLEEKIDRMADQMKAQNEELSECHEKHDHFLNLLIQAGICDDTGRYTEETRQ